MIESLLALLAFLVFGVLWLSTQSWFDLLPRRVTRRVGLVGLIVVTFAAYFAPTAFNAGVQRWMGHVIEAAQDKARGVLEGVVDSIVDGATPAPTPPEGDAPPPAPAG